MKKLILIILSLIILLNVAACWDEIKNPEDTDENTQSEVTD